jgi:hypothetical protein
MRQWARGQGGNERGSSASEHRPQFDALLHYRIPVSSKIGQQLVDYLQPEHALVDFLIHDLQFGGEFAGERDRRIARWLAATLPADLASWSPTNRITERRSRDMHNRITGNGE